MNDPNKRTGRTTRMLACARADAKLEALTMRRNTTPRKVYIVSASKTHAARLAQEFGEPMEGVEFVTWGMVEKFIHLPSMTLSGELDRIRALVYIDHYTLESVLDNALRWMHTFDLEEG